MINRTIHFPSLIIDLCNGVSKALKGVSLTQVVANILQVQVQTPKKSKQSHHLSTKTLLSLWFDLATSCVTSYDSPYPSVSQNREWMWSIWSICASDLSAISAWRSEKKLICQGCRRFETSVFFSVKMNISTTGGSRVGFFQPDTNHP